MLTTDQLKCFSFLTVYFYHCLNVYQENKLNYISDEIAMMVFQIIMRGDIMFAVLPIF